MLDGGGEKKYISASPLTTLTVEHSPICPHTSDPSLTEKMTGVHLKTTSMIRGMRISWGSTDTLVRVVLPELSAKASVLNDSIHYQRGTKANPCGAVA